nr:two-component regulator propeller domain-containing protein [uncultured Carboxylicivirga sp.]
MKHIITISLSLLLISSLNAQWYNNWRDHFSYRNCEHIAESDNYIIGATETGLIIYNYLTGETKKISTVSGLNDVGISAIASVGDDTFIIGYETGNIDLYSINNVYNIPDLKNKSLQGSKKINHFKIHEGKVYCSTNFGILVINIEKKEISDTYYLGLNSSNLIINQCEIVNNSIYAATERGLLRADLDDPLIAYYQSWSDIGSSSLEHVTIKSFQNDLVTIFEPTTNNYSILYGNEDNWSSIKTTRNYKNIGITDNELILSETNLITKYDSNFNVVESIKEYDSSEVDPQTINLNEAYYSEDKHFYFIVDKNHGIVVKDDQDEEFILPDGPYSNNAFDLHFSPHGLYTVAGALTTDYNNTNTYAEYSFYQNGQWNYYKNKIKDEMSLWRDLIRICSDPTDESIVYMSSWGGGIFVVQNGKIINQFNQFNSALTNIFPNGNQNYVRVGGIATDSEGNVWMSNSEVENGIVIRDHNDTTKWHQFSYETLNNLHSVKQILIAKNDFLWIIIPNTTRRGLLVINPNGTLTDQADDQYRGPVSKGSETDNRNVGQLKIWDESLNEITNNVYCITEDKNGYIWLGTDNGVVVYYRPWAIFSDDYPIASRIKIPRNDGSNLADYLLENENITCITVDGANRKWIGTQNSGLFLVSDDGVTSYETFNIDNSPLPSNYINDIAIDPNSGEVFIATSKGIVSYKGKATEGHEDLNTIYAYPNPVREDFSGEITITGLVKDSNVKITTASGKLVYETRSLGGRAYWNGRNLSGEKVKSGVYIAYISSEDGSEVQTTKILIVR